MIFGTKTGTQCITKEQVWAAWKLDDIVIHTRSVQQSDFIYNRLKSRLAQYALELNEEKTHNVYCYRTARFHKEAALVARIRFFVYSFLRCSAGRLIPALAGKK